MSPNFVLSVKLFDFFAIVLFVISLILCFRPYSPRYMKSFPIYCFVNAVVDPIVSTGVISMNSAYSAFTVFELFYFTIFLATLIDSKKIRRIMLYIDIVFLLTLISIIKFIGMPIYGVIILESCIILVPCLIYFRRIFSQKVITDLSSEPSFWMVTGIAFYFFLEIPTLSFSIYFIDIHRRDLFSAVYSVNNYSQLISFVLYVKAMTCKVKKTY